MEDKEGLLELSTKENISLTDLSIKYFIIVTILDYLVIVKQITNREHIPIKEVKEWLNKQSTFDFNWKTSYAKTEFWLIELTWLDLISIDEQTQTMSLTPHGFEVYKSQEFHIAYANLLNSKGSRKLSKAAFGASIIAVATSIITIIIA